MSNDDGEVNIGFGLDGSESLAEIKRIQDSLGKLTGDITHTQKIIERSVRDTIASLGKLQVGAANGSAQWNAKAVQEAKRLSVALSHQGRGGLAGQINRASGDAVISDLNNTIAATQTRIVDAIVTSYGRALRSSSDAIAARLKSEEARVQSLITRNQPTFLAAQGKLQSRSYQRTIDRANNPQLLKAEDRLRQQQDALTIEKANNVELARAKESLRRTAEDRTIERANNVKLQEAQETIRRWSEARTLGRAANPALEDASNLLRSRAEQQRIGLAGNATLLGAQDTLRSRRESQQIFEAQNGRAAAQWANTMERFNSRDGADMSGLLGRIAIQATAVSALLGSITGTAGFVVDLDAELHQFQAITATTNSEMESMKDRLIEISEASKFTALEVAQAGTVMGQAGLSAREISDSLESVTKFAAASGSSLAESVDLITATVSVFNLQTSQTADIANTMTAALNLSKLTLDKMSLGMQYAGNTAAQLGIQYTELTAALGAMANSGIRSGSTLGTGLRQLLVDLQAPSAKFTASLKQVGLSVEDVNIESQGLFGVLQRLKDSGFGVSEAFSVFEVRAAAAYAALANNIDMAYELQKSFALSAAAVEANAIQMESVSNTFAKFKSVVGTVAFNALEPFLRMIQDVTNAVADSIAGLNRMPGVLKAIGVAVTGIGAATAATTISALFRGLTTMVPILGATSGALTTMTGAMLGSTAAATAATGAWARLTLVLRANPFVAAATVLATVATAVYAFTSKTEDATTKLDRLRGEMNRVGGEADAVSQKIGAIDQAMANLIMQKDALDENELMREAKLVDLIQQFKELGLEVDAYTSSIDQALVAMRQLRDVELSRNVTNYADKYAAANNVVLAETSTLGSYIQSGQIQKELSALGLGRAGVSRAGRGARSGSQTMIQDDLLRLSPSSSGVMDLLMGRSNRAPNYQQVGGIRAEMSTVRGALQNKTLGLAEGSDEMLAVRQDIQLLDVVLGQLNEIYARQTNIESNRAQAQIALKDQTVAQIQAQNADYRALEKDISAFVADVTTERSRIMRNMTGQGQIDALRDLEGRVSTQKEAFQGRALMGASNFSLDPANANLPIAAVQNTFDQQIDRMADATKDLSTSLTTATEDGLKIIEKSLKDNRKRMEGDIALVVRSRNRAVVASEVKEAQADIAAMYTKLIEQTTAAFTEKLAGADTRGLSDREVLELREQQDSELTSLREKLAEQEELTKQKLLDLEIAAWKERQDVIENQIELTKINLNRAIEELKKVRPGEAMDKLVATISQLQAELLRLGDSKFTAQFNSSGLGQATPVSLGAATGKKANQMLQYFMQQGGYSQTQAAGIIGNLLTESGLNPSAVGDNGKAYGIAQWNDRQPKLREWAARTGRNVGDEYAQADFMMHELNTSESEAGAMLRAATTIEEAVNAIVHFERPSGYNASQRNAADAMHYDRRLGSAMTVAGIPIGEEGRIVTDTSKEAADNVRETTAASVQNAMDQAIRDAELVAAQTASAVITGSATSIDSALANYAEARQAQLDAELSAFDAKNAGAVGTQADAASQRRRELMEDFAAKTADEAMNIMDAFYSRLETGNDGSLENAKAALAAAQAPGSEGKYTSTEIAGLEKNVVNEERAAIAADLVIKQEHLAELSELIAANEAKYGANSLQAMPLLERRVVLERELEALKRTQVAEADMLTRAQTDLGAALQDQVKQWQVRNGIMREDGSLVSQTEQVGAVAGEMLDGLSSSGAEFWANWANGAMTAGQAFRSFGASMLQMISQAIAKALTLQLIMAAIGDGGTGEGGAGVAKTGLQAVMSSLFSSATPAASGGRVPGVGHRDSKLYKLMPGEAVLKRSAVAAIGEDSIDQLNAMGNRKISQGQGPMMREAPEAQGGGTVNVWLVPADQVPPPGPNDIIQVISNNIQQRGSIKTLIKQVQMGQL